MFVLSEAPKVDLANLFGAKEIRVRAGEPLNISLGICGAPEPTVEWAKNGKPLGSKVSPFGVIELCGNMSLETYHIIG